MLPPSRAWQHTEDVPHPLDKLVIDGDRPREYDIGTKPLARHGCMEFPEQPALPTASALPRVNQ